MAALPENNTDRIFVDYQNAIAQHTLVVRTIPEATFEQLGADILDFLANVGALVANSTVTRTRFSQANTNFSVPVDMNLDGYVFGSGAATLDTNPIAITFVGRSNGGRRARASIFGYTGGASAYRVTTTESAAVAEVVSTLNAQSRAFRAIDFLQPIWYSFADIKPSDYWVRRSRG